MTRRTQRGFTLIEMLVVVAIVGVIATLAISMFGNTMPRQRVVDAALEIRGVLHGARQLALAEGREIDVVFFPGYANSSGGTGRIILYRDVDGNFVGGGAVNLDTLKVASPVSGGNGEIIDVIDLPKDVSIGPAVGQGSSAVMPAPFDGIDINVACGFCTGTDKRGAVVFEPTGAARFYATAGTALAFTKGASVSVTSSAGEVRTVAIVASTGALKSLAWKP